MSRYDILSGHSTAITYETKKTKEKMRNENGQPDVYIVWPTGCGPNEHRNNYLGQCHERI